MRLLIDNTDYTAAIATEHLPRIVRRLNAPAEMTFALALSDASLALPLPNARVVLERTSGYRIFTGYLDGPAKYEYLGWGERGPVYRFDLRALSDECLLNRHLLAWRAPFTNRGAGAILKELATTLLPGAFSFSQVQDVERVASFGVTPELNFSENAAELALRTRSSYRVHDSVVTFTPIGSTEHYLNEASPAFSPDALTLTAPVRPVNDITVIGRMEARCHVKDYFLGDGYSLDYPLSHTPFARRAYTIVDDEFAKAPDSTRWSVAGALAVANGKLVCSGDASLRFVEELELGGALVLQHGELSLASGTGIIGGLYGGDPATTTCVAGFRVNNASIQPIVNGAVAGTLVATQASHRYALTTRVFASEPYRRRATFHSSQHPGGAGIGGEDIAASLRVVLELHDIDPANPGTLAAPATILYEGTISNAPAFATYALIQGSLNGTLTHVRVLRVADVRVATQLPNAPARTRLTGALSEGAECRIDSAPELQFYPQHVPPANEAVRVSYRSSGRAVARLRDETHIAALASGSDDGVRSAVRRVASPVARSSTDCRSAAAALLDDTTAQPWYGKYRCTGDALPGGSDDVWPGDALTIAAPSRAVDATTVVRNVEIEILELFDDVCEYALEFANDAASPLAYRADERGGGEPWDETAVVETLADLAAAEVTGITSISVSIDGGLAPSQGGGIEVRRSDFGWGTAVDRNLVARYTSRNFTVPRLSRVQTYYLRQFDAAGRYSEHSTVLHVDYPL